MQVTILSLARLFLRPLLLPIHRWWVRRVKVEDPWEEVTSILIRPGLFGTGSIKPFHWYLEGESRVEVTSIADIASWLAGCEYASDPELFNEPDFWQHPKTFEHLRKGDCEDHALWAWRKVLELKIGAKLMVGRWLAGPSGGENGHAWVIYDSEAGRQLLEPVAKDPGRMVRPLDEARGEYIPHFSVGENGRMVAHAGYLLCMRQEEERRRAKRAAKQPA